MVIIGDEYNIHVLYEPCLVYILHVALISLSSSKMYISILLTINWSHNAKHQGEQKQENWSYEHFKVCDHGYVGRWVGLEKQARKEWVGLWMDVMWIWGGVP